MQLFITRITLVTLCLAPAACSYHFGYAQRDLPGGFNKVAIPVFANNTQEVGIESYFTNALRRQFARSQVAHIDDSGNAPVKIIGKIESVRYGSLGRFEGKSTNSQLNENQLPQYAVQISEYRVYVVIAIELRRSSDQVVLWSGDFKDERVYAAPQVGRAIINTVNPLYNLSARKEVIEQLAYDMMNSAHDRLTENF